MADLVPVPASSNGLFFPSVMKTVYIRPFQDTLPESTQAPPAPPPVSISSGGANLVSLCARVGCLQGLGARTTRWGAVFATGSLYLIGDRPYRLAIPTAIPFPNPHLVTAKSENWNSPPVGAFIFPLSLPPFETSQVK